MRARESERERDTHLHVDSTLRAAQPAIMHRANESWNLPSAVSAAIVGAERAPTVILRLSARARARVVMSGPRELTLYVLA